MAAPVAQTGAGNVTTAALTAGTSITANKPSNVADGDLLVAAVYSSNTTVTFTPPSGWTQQAGQNASRTCFVFTKPIPVAASEAPTTYQWTWSGSSRGLLIVFRVTGADLTNPLDVAGTNSSAGTTSIVAPSVTTVQAATLLLAVYFTNTAAAPVAVLSPPGSMATVGDITVAPAATSDLQVESETLSASGATGTRTATISPSTSGGVGGFMLALDPPASAGTLPTSLPAGFAASIPTAAPPALLFLPRVESPGQPGPFAVRAAVVNGRAYLPPQPVLTASRDVTPLQPSANPAQPLIASAPLPPARAPLAVLAPRRVETVALAPSDIVSAAAAILTRPAPAPLLLRSTADPTATTDTPTALLAPRAVPIPPTVVAPLVTVSRDVTALQPSSNPAVPILGRAPWSTTAPAAVLSRSTADPTNTDTPTVPLRARAGTPPVYAAPASLLWRPTADHAVPPNARPLVARAARLPDPTWVLSLRSMPPIPVERRTDGVLLVAPPRPAGAARAWLLTPRAEPVIGAVIPKAPLLAPGTRPGPGVAPAGRSSSTALPADDP